MYSPLPSVDARVRMAFSAALAMAVAGAAVGATGVAAPQRGGGPGPGGPSSFALFMALDVDHDNTLSAAELTNASAILKQLDRNGDGRVTADEIPAFGRGGFPGREGREGFAGPGGRGEGGGRGEAPEAQPPSADDVTHALMAFDSNGDGVLTRDEVPERFQGLFDRSDSNKDGKLTAAEIRASAAVQTQPANAPERGGFGGERPEDGRGEGGRGRQGRPGAGPDRLMAALDANGDGILSAEEIAGAPAALRRLDVNHDGVVSFDELFGQGGGRG